MTFNEMCHALVKEPFNLSMSQISRMTDYQLVNVYCRGEEDDDREAVKRSRDDALFREQFVKLWRGKGLTDEEIEERWRREGHGR